MNGIIIDSITNTPIPFVNIGVFNKNKGTISNSKGAFNISIPNKLKHDSLTISHLNYYTIKIPIKNIKNQTIALIPKTNELLEVVISNKKKKKRKVGVKSYNPLLWTRVLSKDNDIIEVAQKINIPQKNVRVKYANFYLRRGFESDSVNIRINFYENIDNAPGKKIVFQNIIQKTKIETGWVKIDLTKDYIYLEDDFFIGIEFIPDFKKPLEVYMGAILTKGNGYNKSSSFGKWNKLQGASTINVEIEY
ncbi:MAG: carboxypeptidase-like regulatory domain-containing protein [Algibacter sp.]